MNVALNAARYTTAVDARRWDLLDQVFINGAPVDFTPNGGIRDEYPAIGAWIKDAMAGFAAYQHYLSNFAITVDGDRASARFYVCTQMITIVDGRDEIISDGGSTTRVSSARATGGGSRASAGAWCGGTTPTRMLQGRRGGACRATASGV